MTYVRCRLSISAPRQICFHGSRDAPCCCRAARRNDSAIWFCKVLPHGSSFRKVPQRNLRSQVRRDQLGGDPEPVPGKLIPCRGGDHGAHVSCATGRLQLPFGQDHVGCGGLPRGAQSYPMFRMRMLPSEPWGNRGYPMIQIQFGRLRNTLYYFTRYYFTRYCKENTRYFQ